jgi:simple sugar transport system permease protein
MTGSQQTPGPRPATPLQHVNPPARLAGRAKGWQAAWRAARPVLAFGLRRPVMLPLCLLAAATILFWSASPAFLTTLNISGMLAYAPELGLVALGMTLLLTAGQFDLSVGSVFGAVPLLVFVLVNNHAIPLPAAFILGLLLAAAIGLVNGLLVTKAGISSFLVTLSTQLIVGGAALYLSNGYPQSTLQSQSPLRGVLAGQIQIGGLTIRAGLIWFAAAALICAYILNQTRAGNWITATGGSREAATARGIRTGRLTVGLFITAAVLAGLAGIISDTRLNLAYPTSGTGYELQAIAIAVVGGTSLFGGYGTIAGTAIGALLLQEISNGVVLVGVPGLAYQMFVGAIILLAMLLQTGLKKLRLPRTKWGS